MFGAIYGDVIGSYYENHFTKDYDFIFRRESAFTDDSVMTAAVCRAIINDPRDINLLGVNRRAREYAVRYKQYYSYFPRAGYGQMFGRRAELGGCSPLRPHYSGSGSYCQVNRGINADPHWNLCHKNNDRPENFARVCETRKKRVIEMYYKYETHMHTSEGSLCSNSTAAEMTRRYKEEGYSGIFVTDHFFNGNTAVSEELPWDERVERYCLGYEHALEEGRKIGIDVFFGVEYGNGQADFLTYGVDKEWLTAHPEVMDISIEEYITLVRSAGGMVIQAHPFREAGYIDHFTLVPSVDGVEIVNASHKDPKYNERAKWYCESFGLAPTAGSDSHNTTDRFFRGGVALDHRISSPADYIKAVKERKISLFLPDERVDL